MRTAFVYTHGYSDFDYGSDHPLKIERLSLTYHLCDAYGLFDLPGASLIEAAPAGESDILRFHTPLYVRILKLASEGHCPGFFTHGLGTGDNPVFQGLWEWSRLATGASLQCARLVCEGGADVAFNIAGGLHHAKADEAAGFCYVNDPVVAINHLLDRGRRVMYLDIDAHHGDGVQWAFYEDPRVLTVSFHQDGRTLFPGSGRIKETGRGEGLGYSVNVPMLPGTDDDVFWAGFSEIVPRLLERYGPDVIVSQLGVDTFLDDPLTDLELTTNGFCNVIRYLARYAPAWVALGGGGYHVDHVVRAWTLAWAIMNGVDLPEYLPEGAAEPLRRIGGKDRKLRDTCHKGTGQDRCARRMKECVDYLGKNVFPLIG